MATRTIAIRVIGMDTKLVYILFSDTGTLFSRTIRLYTRMPLNHTSIAFDSDLQQLYSFGRKHPNNPFVGGFVKESVHGSIIRNGQRTMCALYSCEVSLAVYERIRTRIQQMEQNCEQYRYNLLGLFGVLLNVSIEPKKAYFCSQFVASLFQNNGLPLLNKPLGLTKPMDIEHSSLLRPLYRGDLREYFIPAASHEASVWNYSTPARTA